MLALHRQFTAVRVLAAGWIDGVKPSLKSKEEALRLISIWVRCSLRLLLEPGLFHDDRHIGILLRRLDVRLVYLNFSMCVQVPSATRETLIASIGRLINRDYENLALDFVLLGFSAQRRRPGTSSAALGARLRQCVRGRWRQVSGNLTELATTTPVRIPVFFAVVVRSLTFLKGIEL